MDVRVPTASGSHAWDKNSVRREVIPTQLSWVPDMKKSEKIQFLRLSRFTAFQALKTSSMRKRQRIRSSPGRRKRKAQEIHRSMIGRILRKFKVLNPKLTAIGHSHYMPPNTAVSFSLKPLSNITI